MKFSHDRFNAAFQAVRACGVLSLEADPVVNLQVFETLSSSNQTAWELLEQGAPAGTVVLALRQEAGRGQWGRPWVSAAGGLYFSIGLEPDLPVAAAAQLTLCSAWGIATALRQVPARLSGVEQGVPVQLKWLNDLVLSGRKLGGILTETRLHQGRIKQAVIGVGINWKNPVPATGITLRSFLETQPVPLIESLEMLAAIAIAGLLAGYQRWQQTDLNLLLTDYFNLLAHRDRPIPLATGRATLIGISPRGELRVRVQPDTITDAAAPEVEILLPPGAINLGYESCGT